MSKQIENWKRSSRIAFVAFILACLGYIAIVTISGNFIWAWTIGMGIVLLYLLTGNYALLIAFVIISRFIFMGIDIPAATISSGLFYLSISAIIISAIIFKTNFVKVDICNKNKGEEL